MIMFEGKNGKINEMIDEIGDNHISTSAQNPIRDDAFSLSDEEKIKSIQKEIWNLQIEPEIKVKLTEKTGETEFRMTEGSDEFVQLQALLASFVLAGQGKT